eukprot:g4116.t1
MNLRHLDQIQNSLPPDTNCGDILGSYRERVAGNRRRKLNKRKHSHFDEPEITPFSCSYNHDGQFLAITSLEQTCMLYDCLTRSVAQSFSCSARSRGGGALVGRPTEVGTVSGCAKPCHRANETFFPTVVWLHRSQGLLVASGTVLFLRRPRTGTDVPVLRWHNPILGLSAHPTLPAIAMLWDQFGVYLIDLRPALREKRDRDCTVFTVFEEEGSKRPFCAGFGEGGTFIFVSLDCTIFALSFDYKDLDCPSFSLSLQKPLFTGTKKRDYIESLRCHPSRPYLIASRSGRTLHLFKMVTPSTTARLGPAAARPPPALDLIDVMSFEDMVNRSKFSSYGFAGDTDYVYASSWKHNHIFVWDPSVGGKLVSTLVGECHGDRNVCIAWHPHRSELVSISESGETVLWRRKISDKILAFEELEENVLYVEGENEFDMIVDERTGKQIPARYCKQLAGAQVSVEAQARIDVISTLGAGDVDPSRAPGSPLTFEELRRLVVVPARPAAGKGEPRLTSMVGCGGATV